MDTSSVDSLRAAFASRYRFSLGLIDRTQAAFGARWTGEFNDVLSSLFETDDSLDLAAKGYSAFAWDSMRRQKTFEGTGEYAMRTYAEAAHEVYLNETYMESEYLPGLLISHFLWPHHYRQLRFFEDAFLDAVSRSDDRTFAEVGVGTGLYSRRVLERVALASGSGYDISPSSCRFAKRQVDSIHAAGRYEIHLQNVLIEPIAPVSWLICVEVLEHLENPLQFLSSLRDTLRPGGKAFITAALNAAHADHIYLYRETRDVERQLQDAGFVLEQSFSATAYPPPHSGVPVPVAAAFIVAAS